MFAPSSELLVQLDLGTLDPSAASATGASCHGPFPAHGVRRVSPPERRVKRSNHTCSTHEVGEELFIAASQNVASTFGATKVCFVKLQVYSRLYPRLGGYQLVNDLKASFLRLRNRGSHGTSGIQGLPKIRHQALGMEPLLAVVASDSGSIALPGMAAKVRPRFQLPQRARVCSTKGTLCGAASALAWWRK